MKEILMVGLGGFAGSVCRYLISVAMLPLIPQDGIPWHTLLVNVVGSLLIGFLLAAEVQGHWHSLGVVGFCGGFTTFSTFSFKRFSRACSFSPQTTFICQSMDSRTFSTAAVFVIPWPSDFTWEREYISLNNY